MPLTKPQPDLSVPNLRKNLKKCLAYWQEQAGATGTPDADPDEPA